MKPIRRSTIWFVLTLALSWSAVGQDLPRADPEAVGVSPERLGRIDHVLEKYVDEELLPGAVLLVARDGQIVYEKAVGYRDRESADVLEPDDLFRIASQTKALVSTGIMILQERGELLIDDPLSDYLPEFDSTTVAVPSENGGYEIVPAKRSITLRDLLTHTSGISYGYGPAADRWKEAGIQGWYFADRDEPIAETVARMADLPMDAQPGEAWIYGYSIDILGVVIERVSGKPLNEFMRSEIMEPLGMNDTFFYVPPDKADRLTVVYSRTEEGTLERAPDPGGMVGQGAYLEGPRVSFSGGAGLVSTARDYLRFLEMLRQGGALDGVRLLAPSTVELMTAGHVSEDLFSEGQEFGLGFFILRDLGSSGLPGSPGLFGWGGAYHSTYWVDPEERLSVVYLTQVIPAGGLDDHDKIRALIYQALTSSTAEP